MFLQRFNFLSAQQYLFGVHVAVYHAACEAGLEGGDGGYGGFEYGTTGQTSGSLEFYK